MRRNGKTWTFEEISYLEDNWGKRSTKAIAKKLRRNTNSVRLKAYRSGLGDARFNFDGITMNQLAVALNLHHSTLRNWEEKYDFPVRVKVFTESMKVKVITYQNFWKWAEFNKEMIDFSRTERGFMGSEPDWVETKRSADQIRKMHIPQPHNTPWSKKEIGLLKGLVETGSTYSEIQRHIQRTEGAIKRKLFELGVKYRPDRLPNHKKYTTEELEYIENAMNEGRSFEEMAEKLNRSALGIRGKVERMGYKFRNGVPKKVEKIG